MIAGIGGASLGTEIQKCLTLAGSYRVFGCDVSPYAFGHYATGFEDTFLVDRQDYASSVLMACRRAGCSWLIPGGDQPNSLLGGAERQLMSSGITLVGNSPAFVADFSDKAKTFERLRSLGFVVPRTAEIAGRESVDQVGQPCIVKPATGSGGSTMVFFARTGEEVGIYADYLRRSGHRPLAQEYIAADEGEFTVGVLSWPDGEMAGSIALRRSLDTKLSVQFRAPGAVISSGYTQGLIDDFPEVRSLAERIAVAAGSRGPINIQGRLRDGVFFPFEINPRFSASTYLRAMAGFNEVDLFLRHLASGEKPKVPKPRTGWYLRSLAETYVALGEIRR